MLTGRSGDAAVCRFRWVSEMTLSALRILALARGKETLCGGRQTPASRQSRTARSKPSAYCVSCPRLEVTTREERKSSGRSVQCSQQAGILRVAVAAPQHKQRRGDAPESVWLPLITHHTVILQQTRKRSLVQEGQRRLSTGFSCYCR